MITINLSKQKVLKSSFWLAYGFVKDTNKRPAVLKKKIFQATNLFFPKNELHKNIANVNSKYPV